VAKRGIEKAGSGRKGAVAKPRKPVRRARRKTGGEPAQHVETERAAPAAEPPPSGVQVSVDDLVVEATDSEIERHQLRAQLRIRRGGDVLYAERVNLDWPGGRDKFLRKASRALDAAGVATRLGGAVLSELYGLLRARSPVTAGA
jgi:hypothetical protein